MINIKNNYRVGIYTRLSNDDGTNEESVSIDTQKKKFRNIFSRTSNKVYCSK